MVARRTKLMVRRTPRTSAGRWESVNAAMMTELAMTAPATNRLSS
jgi:hypothetical protein